MAASCGTKKIEVLSASTEEVIGSVPEGTPEDVNAAVDAARRAFENGWAETSREERADWLDKIAGALKERGGADRADDCDGGGVADFDRDVDSGGIAGGGHVEIREAFARGEAGARDRELAGGARSGGGGGRDYAVELSAASDYGEGRAGAGGGMYGGAEAE